MAFLLFYYFISALIYIIITEFLSFTGFLLCTCMMCVLCIFDYFLFVLVISQPSQSFWFDKKKKSIFSISLFSLLCCWSRLLRDCVPTIDIFLFLESLLLLGLFKMTSCVNYFISGFSYYLYRNSFLFAKFSGCLVVSRTSTVNITFLFLFFFTNSLWY